MAAQLRRDVLLLAQRLSQGLAHQSISAARMALPAVAARPAEQLQGSTVTIDLELLAYLCHKGAPYIDMAVDGTGYLPRTVIGVGTFLLDYDGDVDLLTAKQRVTYEKFLLPLLFAVPCQGKANSEGCRGDGLIDADLLLKSYRDGDFRCRLCRTAEAPPTAV